MNAATTRTYVRYSDDVKVEQPGEDEQTQQVTESMARVNKIMFERYRHAIGDAHAKSHGILKARYRHDTNTHPRMEPDSIDQLPD